MILAIIAPLEYFKIQRNTSGLVFVTQSPKSSKKFRKQKKTQKTIEFLVLGGDERDRTADLLNAIIYGHNKMNILGIISP